MVQRVQLEKDLTARVNWVGPTKGCNPGMGFDAAVGSLSHLRPEFGPSDFLPLCSNL